MAEPWGAGAELAERERAFRRAAEVMEAARARALESRRPRPGLTDELASQQDEAESQVRAAEAPARTAALAYEHAYQSHPATQYRQILAEAGEVQAPKMSGWQWFAQNPSLLEAVPLSDEARREQARLSHVLKRVHEASNARPPHDPFSWGNYQGPESQHMAALQALAAEHFGVPGTEFTGNPERRRQLDSPYHYRPFNRDEDGDLLPMPGSDTWHRQASESGSLPEDQLLEAFRPLSAAWGGVSRWKDNFASGGAALAEGRLGDAAKGFGYAIPNLVSPSFHRGAAGADGDWRGYLEPREAAALDVAAELPLLFSRGLYRGRPGTGVAALGAEDRIRQYRDELLGTLYRRAARRHHPDVGGSVDTMKQINEAASAGDLESLRRFAQ